MEIEDGRGGEEGGFRDYWKQNFPLSNSRDWKESKRGNL